MTSRTIEVDYLARVEGEGGMSVRIRGGKVEDVQLRIFEPPRFFEAFLRGRAGSEAPDITARICGICPVAYQMSAVHAIEAALGLEITPTIRELRRLLYCGEWIESHILHVYMLHAPDFLGYESAIHMAADHKDVVERGLALKKIGNAIVETLAGRAIHPINVRVGGFHRILPRHAFRELRAQLQEALGLAETTVRWCAQLDFPEFERDYELVALHHPDEYPFNEGRIISNRGLDIPIEDYGQHFREVHVAHSNALQCVHIDHGAYFVGPMARYNLNFDQLPDAVRQLAAEVGLEPPCYNPFKSIIIRALETYFAVHEAIRIIDGHRETEPAHVRGPIVAGVGHGCTEAPRGLLYHRYELDEDGNILQAQIVPPTSQNQGTIENDLREFVGLNVELDDEQLQWQCEQAIRNYDPCISCATHFLNMKVDRQP